MPLSAGEHASDSILPDGAGDPVTLSDFHGRPVVLYFYPKADSLGS